MSKKQNGNTLLENVISMGILCVYIVVVVGLTNNLLYQQEIYNDSLRMNSLIQNTAEEFLNKKYAEVAVGTTNDEVEEFDRTIVVTESSNLKEISIKIFNSEGEMNLTVEKGLDIN
ncbi:MAG: hypothetical protein ACM3UU_11185 [Ignavibacteriales bacterium]